MSYIARMMRDDKFSMRMPAELKAALQRRADAEDRSLASYVTRVLQAHVDKAPYWDDPADAPPKASRKRAKA